MIKGRLSERTTTARELLETHFYAPGLRRWVIAKAVALGELENRDIPTFAGAIGFAVLPESWEDPFENKMFAARVREAKSRARMAAEFMITKGKEKLPTEILHERMGVSDKEAFATFAIGGNFDTRPNVPRFDGRVVSDLRTQMSAAEAAHAYYCFRRTLGYDVKRTLQTGEFFGQAERVFGRHLSSLHAQTRIVRFAVRAEGIKGIYALMAKSYRPIPAIDTPTKDIPPEELNMSLLTLSAGDANRTHLMQRNLDDACDFFDMRLDCKERPAPAIFNSVMFLKVLRTCVGTQPQLRFHHQLRSATVLGAGLNLTQEQGLALLRRLGKVKEFKIEGIDAVEALPFGIAAGK